MYLQLFFFRTLTAVKQLVKLNLKKSGKGRLKYEKDSFCSCFFAPNNLSWRL